MWLIVDLLVHELLVLLRGKNMLQLRIEILDVLHGLCTGIADLSLVHILEMKVEKGISYDAIRETQLAHHHFGLLTSNILGRAFGIVLRHERYSGTKQNEYKKQIFHT